MRPITFLASYPRSGNTFLRALLANHKSDLNRPLTVNEIAQFGAGEQDFDLWDSLIGSKPADGSPKEQWLARPKYFDAIRARPGAGRLVMKTHTLDGLSFGRPAFDIQPFDRIVYIVRNPLDVVVSGADFFKLTFEQMCERMLQSGACNRVGPLFEVVGSWNEHVGGWLNETRAPILIVRYRDLVLDTARQLRIVLRFLNIPTTRKRIEKAVDRSDFSRLQFSNLKEGFDQGPDRDPTALFFRVGKPDQWKQALPREVVSKIDAGCGPLMDILNFERPGFSVVSNRPQVQTKLKD